MIMLLQNLPSGALLAPVLAGLAAVLAIAAMLRFRHALPMDQPNHRSLHSAPIPRSGGLGIMAGVVVGWGCVWLAVGAAAQIHLLLLALVLSAFSLLDDVRGLPVTWRFAAQIIVASLLISGLGQPPLVAGPLAMVAAVLVVVWMTNLYNFMDGSNGLAGGMAFFGFGFYALAAALGGNPVLALVAASIAVAAAGFLLFNFNPARIFMGDSGSIPLGFLAAAMGLAGWQQGLWSALLPLLVFSPFIIDASVTLTRRLLRGEKIWQAHREHYYQRLIRMGVSHKRTALAEYALMLVCGSVAMLLREGVSGPLWPLLVAVLAIYGFIMGLLDRAWRRHGTDR